MKRIKRFRTRIVDLIPRLGIRMVYLISQRLAPSKMRFTVKRRPTPHSGGPGKLAIEFLALFLTGIALLSAQTPKQSDPVPASAPQSSTTSSPTAPNTLPPIQLDGPAALHHLNQVISWYRHSTTGIQSVGLPSDAIYQDNAQSLGAQIVRLAFQSAKAETAITTAQQKAGNTNSASGETTQQQSLAQLKAKTSSQIDQLQSQVETLNSQISKAPPVRRASLVSQRDAVQSELELQKALLDAIQKMAGV